MSAPPPPDPVTCSYGGREYPVGTELCMPNSEGQNKCFECNSAGRWVDTGKSCEVEHAAGTPCSGGD